MKNSTEKPAVLGPAQRQVRPAVAVAHRSDKHLTLLGAPYHWNLLTGVDRADMLAFGRACMEAERERIADLISRHSGLTLETMEYLEKMRQGPTPEEWANLDRAARV